MSGPLQLSMLDQAPVSAGSTPAQALQHSLALARHGDELGYTRLWYSEHHAMALLACTAPEILIARAAAATNRIRVGSGGIMLTHYAPFKVAEVFRTLHAMFPGRIDLGLGRAPGGSQLESLALRRNRKAAVPDDFPEQLAELQAFLHPERFPPNHPFARTLVAPAAPGAPQLWLLGSSMWSAVAASQLGLPYAFAHFFSPIQTRQAIEFYRRNFMASADLAAPRATLCIGVICAETEVEAQRLHAPVRLLQRRIRSDDRRPVATPEDALRELNEPAAAPIAHLPATVGSRDAPEDNEWPRYLVGTPDKVAAQLRALAEELHPDELLINTITHSQHARLRSYTLLAEAMDLQASAREAELYEQA